MQMSAYHYKIKLQWAQAHSSVDGLSCLLLNEGHFVGHYEEPGIFNMS